MHENPGLGGPATVSREGEAATEMKTPLPLSPYQRHVKNWENCKRCPLHTHRHKVVLYKGAIPCDVLFIGEAPGISENVIGKPFVGRAGDLLRRIVHNATLHLETPIKIGYTNLIACIPMDDEGSKKVNEPPVEAIEACGPRVEEIVTLANPKIVVFVGAMAEAWLDPRYVTTVKMPGGCLYDRIYHPAWMLRQGVTQQGLLAQEAEVVVKNVIDDLLYREKNSL